MRHPNRSDEVGQDGHRTLGARYRTDYLKLRSALYDRTTGLPAFPVLFDRLRTMLDRRRRIGVLHLEVANLGQVESLYGWQVFDRILSRVARELSGAVGEELPGGTLVGVSGVGRFLDLCGADPFQDRTDVIGLFQYGSVVAVERQDAGGDDQYVLRRVTKHPDGRHVLKAANPDYPDFEANEEMRPLARLRGVWAGDG